VSGAVVAAPRTNGDCPVGDQRHQWVIAVTEERGQLERQLKWEKKGMRRLTMSLILGSALTLVAQGVMAQPPGGRGGFGPSRMPLMNTLDANHDGVLSAAELEKAS